MPDLQRQPAINLTFEEVQAHMPLFLGLVEEVEQRLALEVTVEAALREFVALFRQPVSEQSKKVIEEVLLESMPKRQPSGLRPVSDAAASPCLPGDEETPSTTPKATLSGLQAFKSLKGLAQRTLNEVERVSDSVPRSLAVKPLAEAAEGPAPPTTAGVDGPAADSGRPPGPQPPARSPWSPSSPSSSSPLPAAKKARPPAKRSPRPGSPKPRGRRNRSPSPSPEPSSPPPTPVPDGRPRPLFPRPMPTSTANDQANGHLQPVFPSQGTPASPPAPPDGPARPPSLTQPVFSAPTPQQLPLVVRPAPGPVVPYLAGDRRPPGMQYWCFTAATPNDDPAWHRVQLCRVVGEMCDVLLLDLSLEKTVLQGDLHTDEERERIEESGALLGTGDDEFLSLLAYGDDV